MVAVDHVSSCGGGGGSVLPIASVTFDSDGRFSDLHIQRPVSTSCCKSTPDRTPNPLSMNTTSSVAALPDAPRAYGQPPSPDTDESTTAMP